VGAACCRWKAESFEWSHELRERNRDMFGNRDFRHNQLQIMNATLSGRDVFVLMPTGAVGAGAMAAWLGDWGQQHAARCRGVLTSRGCACSSCSPACCLLCLPGPPPRPSPALCPCRRRQEPVLPASCSAVPRGHHRGVPPGLPYPRSSAPPHSTGYPCGLHGQLSGLGGTGAGVQQPVRGRRLQGKQNPEACCLPSADC
jgi:hypothetical protein